MKHPETFSLGVAIVVVALILPFAIGNQKRSDGQAPSAAARKPAVDPHLSAKSAAALDPAPRAKAKRMRPITMPTEDSQTTSSARIIEGVPDVPCDDCGTGDHWIDDPLCPGGLDHFSTTALVGLDTSLDCKLDTSLVLFDASVTTILRSDPLDDSQNFPGLSDIDNHRDVIDTTIDFLLLTNTNADVFLAAGRATILPLAASLGAIMEQPNNPALADSFFDVNFELEFGGTFLYNQQPLRVEAKIDCVSPKALYLHITGCHELFTSPNPGEGVHVANLVSAQHETFPDPCPDLGDCCTAHQGSGCMDATCCQEVCAADASCCGGGAFAWGEACAQLAWQFCPSCIPFGTTYSISPGVRPAGKTGCQSVADPNKPGEPDDIVRYDGLLDEIRTLENDTIPFVFETRFPLPDNVTSYCFTMFTFLPGDLFPLPGGPNTGPGDACVEFGVNVPLKLPPGSKVVGAGAFAASGPDVLFDEPLDPAACAHTNDAISCNVNLPGVAGMKVDIVDVCLDVAVNAPGECEPTADEDACEPVTCPDPTDECVATGAIVLDKVEGTFARTACDCVEPGGCRVFVSDFAVCLGTCPPCETCLGGGFGETEASCTCERIGDINGDDIVDLRDYQGFQVSFGRIGVTGTKHECADLNDDGRVDDLDYIIFVMHFVPPP